MNAGFVLRDTRALLMAHTNRPSAKWDIIDRSLIQSHVGRALLGRSLRRQE